MPGVKVGALQGDTAHLGDWEEVGEVEKLYIYPVKSLAGHELDSFRTGKFAAENVHLVDRQFCVVNTANGNIMSSRRYPVMSLIKAQLTADEITLSAPNRPSITVARAGDRKAEEPVNVFGDPCLGVDLGQAVGRWLADTVGKSDGLVKLVEHQAGVDSSRPDKNIDEYLSPLGQPQDKPLFADNFAYMMMTSASIDDLNKKLKESGVDLQVENTRFRQNILVKTRCPAYEEDQWVQVRMGEAEFRNVQPCDRCVFTTVDPFKGELNARGQPLKLLRTYRSTEDPVEKKKYGTSPFFGVNLGITTMGEVKVGDKVYVKKVMKI